MTTDVSVIYTNTGLYGKDSKTSFKQEFAKAKVGVKRVVENGREWKVTTEKDPKEEWYSEDWEAMPFGMDKFIEVVKEI